MKTRFQAFLITIVLAFTGGFAEAQQAPKVPRVGYLGGSSHFFEAFQQGLRELGYVDGRNIIVESRLTQDGAWALQLRAAELVRLKPEVIVVSGASAADATISKLHTIPIVIVDPADPYASGLVASLERPGGNVTGVGAMVTQLGGKWLELLKEAVPGMRRVAVFWNQFGEERIPMRKEIEVVARSLRVDLQPIEVLAKGRFRRSDYLQIAFSHATSGRADALIVLTGGVFADNQSRIAELALQNRLPAIYWQAGFAFAGGLIAYGPKLQEQHRRAAYFVDKILKGAKPGDLPVERPTQFELVINLKTAREIGVTIQPEVLMFADRVIK